MNSHVCIIVIAATIRMITAIILNMIATIITITIAAAIRIIKNYISIKC